MARIRPPGKDRIRLPGMDRTPRQVRDRIRLPGMDHILHQVRDRIRHLEKATDTGVAGSPGKSLRLPAIP